MFAFKTTFNADSNEIVARNAHGRGETFAILTVEAGSGTLLDHDHVDLDELVEVGILVREDEGRLRLRGLNDGSPEAQAKVWGDLAKQTMCSCDHEPSVEDWKRFERHDDHAEFTGSHGFACPKCFGIVQIG